MANRLPPLPALKSFEALSRLGSVGAAAEELHVTHGAVSHQVRALEEHLGTQLLKRGSRQLALTEEGRIYAYQVRQALDDLEEATGRLMVRSPDPQLTIAVLPSFTAFWLLPRLPSFVQGQHSMRLSLRASMAFADFESEPSDCAIRFGHGQWPEVHAERLMGEASLLVCAPHFRNGAIPSTAEEALECPLLHASESWSTWLHAAGADERRPRALLEFTDSTHMIQAARLGLGIALTRRSLVHDLLESGELVRVTEIEAQLQSSYYLVWPRKNHKIYEVQIFRQWIQSEISTYLAKWQPPSSRGTVLDDYGFPASTSGGASGGDASSP
jgi:LysR family glycine cleavage system transcriptional activator